MNRPRDAFGRFAPAGTTQWIITPNTSTTSNHITDDALLAALQENSEDAATAIAGVVAATADTSPTPATTPAGLHPDPLEPTVRLANESGEFAQRSPAMQLGEVPSRIEELAYAVRPRPAGEIGIRRWLRDRVRMPTAYREHCQCPECEYTAKRYVNHYLRYMGVPSSKFYEEVAPTMAEKLKSRGITVLTDADGAVVDGRFVWPDFHPSKSVVVKSHHRMLDVFAPLEHMAERDRAHRRNRPVYMHETRVMDVTGMFKRDTNDGVEYRMYDFDLSEGTVFFTKELPYYGIEGPNKVTSWLDASATPQDGWVRIPTTELSPAMRRIKVTRMVRNIRHRAQSRDADSYYAVHDRVALIESNIHDMLTRREIGPTEGRIIGGRWSVPAEHGYSEKWLKMKHAAKEFGRVIGRAKAGVETAVDARTVMNLYSNTSWIIGRPRETSLRLWNRFARPEHRTMVDPHSGDLMLWIDGVQTAQGRFRRSYVEEYFRTAADTGQLHHVDHLYPQDDGTYLSVMPREQCDTSDRRVGGRVKDYTMNVLNTLQADESVKPTVYGDVLMGVEFEMQVVGGRSDFRDAVCKVYDELARGYAILKRDGSIGDNGIELVTAPRGLSEHIRRLTAWEPHTQMRAWDGAECGIHVHLSSKSFTAGTLGKLLEFINHNDNAKFITKIAGRHPKTDRRAAQYCQQEGQRPAGNPKAYLRNKDSERYRMVNLLNLSRAEARRLGMPDHSVNGKDYDTVELRIFRASMKKARYLAQVEFAHAALMFCRWSSAQELREKHFMAWLQKSAGLYPNLAKWFGVRAHTDIVTDYAKVSEIADA